MRQVAYTRITVSTLYLQLSVVRAIKRLKHTQKTKDIHDCYFNLPDPLELELNKRVPEAHTGAGEAHATRYQWTVSWKTEREDTQLVES